MNEFGNILIPVWYSLMSLVGILKISVPEVFMD